MAQHFRLVNYDNLPIFIILQHSQVGEITQLSQKWTPGPLGLPFLGQLCGPRSPRREQRRTGFYAPGGLSAPGFSSRSMGGLAEEHPQLENHGTSPIHTMWGPR